LNSKYNTPNGNDDDDNNNNNKISPYSEKTDVTNDSLTGIGKGISTYDTPDGFQISIDFKSFMSKKHDNFTKRPVQNLILEELTNSPGEILIKEIYHYQTRKQKQKVKTYQSLYMV